MIEWIGDNREWIFSGVGVAIISTVVFIIRVAVRKEDAANSYRQNSSVHRLRIRAGGDVKISTVASSQADYLAIDGVQLRHLRATILSPPDGSLSAHHVLLAGRCSPLPTGVGLWLLTQEASSDLFHPDDGPIAENHGRWMGRASIGNRQFGADAAMKFKVHLVAADAVTSAHYHSYLEHAHRRDAWRGIADLMGGRILASIEVQRDDEDFFPVT